MKILRWASPRRSPRASPKSSPKSTPKSTPRTSPIARPRSSDVARRLLSPPSKKRSKRRRSRSPPVTTREYAYWRNRRKPPGPSPLSRTKQRIVVFDAFGMADVDTTVEATFGTPVAAMLQAFKFPKRTQYLLVRGRDVRQLVADDRVAGDTVVLVVPPGSRLP